MTEATAETQDATGASITAPESIAVPSALPALAERAPQTAVTVVAAWILGSTALSVGGLIGWRQAALLILGAGLGIALYHAAFGFTAHWRAFLTRGDGRGIRAELVLLALTVTLFFPALEAGNILGRPVGGFVVPVGVSLCVGAFLFGIGMQLANGCGSGTLFTLGGGSTRMIVTLAAFVVGSLVATHHLDWWFALPALPPVSLVRALGAWPAVTLHLIVFAMAAAATLAWERHSGIPRQGTTPLAPDVSRVWRGPWPLFWGAAALAGLSFLMLATAGHPWGITSAFALWGAKIATVIGVDVVEWPYWARRAGALERSVFADTTSLSNFGIVLGALMAAGLAGRFAPKWRQPWRSLAAAAIGGLLLGYGARLASGCNIGAFFGGIVSGSPHGWVWFVAAMGGSAVGVRLRPAFGLSRS